MRANEPRIPPDASTQVIEQSEDSATHQGAGNL
jgi:hypothetical protein